MSDLKSKPRCKDGKTCIFHKAGKCKFVHDSVDGKGHVDTKRKIRSVARSNQSGHELMEATKKLLSAVTINMNSRKALNAELKTSIGGYFDVKDKKEVTIIPDVFARQLKLLDDELLALRAVAKGMWGTKAFSLTSWYTWQLSIAVTTGVVNGTQTIDPSGQTEWIAAASLFDEYKVVGLNAHYRVKTAVNYSSVEIPHGVICYDPTTSGSLTGVTNGLELAQHQLVLLPSTYEALPNKQSTTFKIVIPKGIQETNFSLGIGNWLPVNAPLPYGYVKFYCTGDNKTAVTNGGFGAMMECHSEFRIRE